MAAARGEFPLERQGSSRRLRLDGRQGCSGLRGAFCHRRWVLPEKASVEVCLAMEFWIGFEDVSKLFGLLLKMFDEMKLKTT